MEERKNNIVSKRALVILLSVFIFVVVIFSRFVYIQAAKEVQGYDIQSLIEERWSKSTVLDGKRGSIYDKNGETLAEEVPSYTIVAIMDERYNNHVENIEETAIKLSTVLDMDSSDIRNYLQNGKDQNRVQVELGTKAKYLSYEKKTEIETLELSGILFREDPKRYYPKQDFVSHILGYTERDMKNARMGIESNYNDYLVEEDGHITYQKDGANRKLWNAEESIEPAKDGADIYLTIDTKIQMVIEQTMNQVDELYEPERMMAIVANAKTGEILGMSNRPSFNPNEYEKIENYTNFNISSRFEPGSTMKIFSLAAAIDAGVYNGDETFQSGSFPVDGYVIRDHNRAGWGQISFNEGVQRSSNVAFSIIALDKLGPDLLYRYIEEFGFNQPTGIDLSNEATGLIAKGSKSEAATTAFGQGTAVTPIQQVQAATAIANGGKMMKPYVIDRIVSADGEVILKNEPELGGEPISAETSKQVLQILESVITSNVGTGRPYAIDGFSLAGKSGTAQIPREDGPGYIYGHGNYIYSFLGMAPAENPEVIVFVAVDRPNIAPDEQGSVPVSMIFKSVMKQSLQYLKIAPSKNEENINVENELTQLVGESVSKGIAQLEKSNLQPIVIGEGNKIEKQYPAKGSYLISGEKVFLKTDGDSFLMPDVTGWSARQIFVLQDFLGMNVLTEGDGFVYQQTPDPGTKVTNVKNVILQLKPPYEEEVEEGDDEINNVESHLSEEDEDEEFFMD